MKCQPSMGDAGRHFSDANAFGGDGKKVLEWLRIALEAGFMNHAYLSRHDPFIANFRDFPEREVLGQLKERQLAFESKLAPIS